MIISASESHDFAETVRSLSADDPFACRVIAQYECYRPGLSFVDYWLTADGGGNFSGAIARNGSNYVLFLTENSDIGEISSFLRLSGFSSVLCDGGYSLELDACESSGAIMKTAKELAVNKSESINEPTIREAYDLIAKCAEEGFMPPPFEDFYVDVNHKLRHNAMRLIGMRDGEALAAVAMSIAETDDLAVLGAAACHPDFRGKGYGSYIIAQITNSLINEDKTVYLYRALNKNVRFFKKLGFVECGTWKEYVNNG